MADQKPPRFAGDERATLCGLLQYQRESVVRKLADLADGAAAHSPVPTGISLLWLVKHLTAAEVTWGLRRFAGDDVAVPSDVVGPQDTVAGAVEAYRAVGAAFDAVVAGTPSLDAPCRGLTDGGAEANLRWVLAHLLQETARHAGHADILRELHDGRTGR
jgi:hypothetical protein